MPAKHLAGLGLLQREARHTRPAPEAAILSIGLATFWQLGDRLLGLLPGLWLLPASGLRNELSHSELRAGVGEFAAARGASLQEL